MRYFPIFAFVFSLLGTAVQAQSVQSADVLVPLKADWPCYFQDTDGKWYDCPKEVVGGNYVLGPPIAPPELSAEVTFDIDEPTRYYIDGVARCDGCYNVMGGGQWVLLHWDGSAWQSVWVGFADHVEKCTRWDEGCDFTAPAPGPGLLEPGRYKLWVQSSDGAAGFRARTLIDIAIRKVVEVDLGKLKQAVANCEAALAQGKAQLAALESQLKALQDAEALSLGGHRANVIDDLAQLHEFEKGPGYEHVLELLDPIRKIKHLEDRIALERRAFADAQAMCRELSDQLAALKAGQ